MEKEYKFASAVIYIHNEQKNIQTFIKMVYNFLQSHFYKFEIICVDDASGDDSVKRIQKIVKQEELLNVSLISMDIYQGREASMEAGVDLSIGDYVYELEWIDMSDPIHYEDVLWEAYSTALKGYDIVSYSSNKPKSFSTSTFYKIYNKSNLNYTPLTPERFRIVTRRAINRVSNMNNAIVYRKALYSNCGLKSTVLGEGKLEVKFVQKNVQRNKSKLGTNVLLAYTSFFQKISLVFNVVLGINFICALMVVAVNLVQKDVVSSITMIWLGISLLASILGLLTLFVLKYQELILELILKNEKYIVGSVDKLVNSEGK